MWVGNQFPFPFHSATCRVWYYALSRVPPYSQYISRRRSTRRSMALHEHHSLERHTSKDHEVRYRYTHAPARTLRTRSTRHIHRRKHCLCRCLVLWTFALQPKRLFFPASGARDYPLPYAVFPVRTEDPIHGSFIGMYTGPRTPTVLGRLYSSDCI